MYANLSLKTFWNRNLHTTFQTAQQIVVQLLPPDQMKKLAMLK